MKKLHLIIVWAKSFTSAKMIIGISLIPYTLFLFFVHFTFVRFLFRTADVGDRKKSAHRKFWELSEV